MSTDKAQPQTSQTVLERFLAEQSPPYDDSVVEQAMVLGGVYALRAANFALKAASAETGEPLYLVTELSGIFESMEEIVFEFSDDVTRFVPDFEALAADGVFE